MIVIDQALPRQEEPPAMCGQDVGQLGEAAVLWVNCPLGWTGGQISTISVFQEMGPLAQVDELVWVRRSHCVT